MSDLDDAALLQAIVSRDELALRVFVQRYAPLALAVASQLLLAPSAEALTAETFRDMWRGTEVYEASKGTVRTWLLGRVHSRAIELARDRPSARRHPVDQVSPALGFGAPAGAMLRRLPAQERQIVELMYFHGLTVAEVSERLGIAPPVVTAGCCSAMRALREPQEWTGR